MTAIRATLARHPLLWFFALTLVPVALAEYIGVGFDLVIALYLYTAGPIAVLVCWASSVGGSALPRTNLRPLVFFAGTAAITLLVANALGDPFGGRFLVKEILIAAACGFTVSCLWSPSPAVRDLVRPLLRWRVSWTTYAFALLALPLLAVVVVAASRLLPARPSNNHLLQPSGVLLWHLAAKAFAYDLVLQIPFIVGWYGFAARRLLARHSPLLVGLLLGILLAAALWLPTLRSFSDTTHLARFSVGEVALAIISVWLYGRARGSLLPLLLLQAAADLGAYAIFWAGLGLGGFEAFQWALALTQSLLGVCLVVGWRMWRGPAGERPTETVEAAV